jgi:predicted porin
MFTRQHSRSLGALCPALALLLLLAPAAAAQEATLYGVAGADGDDTNIVLAGATVRPAGAGLRPVVGLQAYRLGYDRGGTDGSTQVLAVTPSAGLEYRGSGGSVGGRVGYTFQSADDDNGTDVDAPFIGGEGGRSGIVTSVQANTWSTPAELQGIASYNWASEYIWTQAQAVVPVARVSAGTIGVGAEAVFQGETSNDGGSAYRAYELGPVLRFNNGRSFLVTLSGGLKSTNVEDRDNTYFARVSVVRYGLNF